MKWIKLLIIVISLSLPIHSYACWDDDMDDDDDGWWDDDIGSWTNTDEKNYINAPDYWKNQTWLIMSIFLLGRNGRFILSIGNHKMEKIVCQ